MSGTNKLDSVDLAPAEAAQARDAIERMKAGEPIDEGDVRSIVRLAESADRAWDALGEYRRGVVAGVERWKAGDEITAWLRQLLEKAGRAFREYERGHRAKADMAEAHGDAKGYPHEAKSIDEMRDKAEFNAVLARQIEDALAPRTGRELIWPRTDNLVVWMIDVIERSVGVPPIAEVEALRLRLARAIVASGGNVLARDSKLMIEQLAEALRASERQRFIADQRTREIEQLVSKAGEVVTIAINDLWDAGTPADIAADIDKLIETRRAGHDDVLVLVRAEADRAKAPAKGGKRNFVIMAVARADIEEKWLVEAESEDEAREIFESNDPDRPIVMVRDRVAGNEEDREIVSIEPETGNG